MPIVDASLQATQGVQARDFTVNETRLIRNEADLLEVRISRAEGKHEYARISARIAQPDSKRLIDKPIAFRYGPRVNEGTFYGYVVEAQPSADYKVDKMVDLHCFGPTWRMQSGKPRVSKGRVASMAAQIVGEHRLGFQGDLDSYEWPVLAQSHLSDWEYINHLASRVGFSVYYDTGVVRFVDARRVLRTTIPVARLLKGDDVFDTSRQLFSFDGGNTSDRLRTKQPPSFGFFVNGVPTTNNPQTYPYRFETRAVVKNREMAAAYQAAWERKTDTWSQAATARILGDPRISPGLLVSIDLSGSHTIKNEFDGLWLVDAVEHSLNKSSFQTKLTLVRDKDRGEVVNTNYQTLWGTNGKPRLLQVEIEPGVQGWASSWTRPVFSEAS